MYAKVKIFDRFRGKMGNLTLHFDKDFFSIYLRYINPENFVFLGKSKIKKNHKKMVKSTKKTAPCDIKGVLPPAHRPLFSPQYLNFVYRIFHTIFCIQNALTG